MCCRAVKWENPQRLPRLPMHTAFYQPDSLILLLSPSLRQSSELFIKCLDVYRTFKATCPGKHGE